MNHTDDTAADKARTIGAAMPCTEVKIVDTDTGDVRTSRAAQDAGTGCEIPVTSPPGCSSSSTRPPTSSPSTSR